MAEEKKDGKNFYQFKITRDPEKKEKIENLKAKVPFAHLLTLFDINDDDDEATIINKMNVAVQAIMRASDMREEDGKTGKKKGKASEVDRLPEKLKELYKADEALTDDDKVKYEEYEYKLAQNPEEEDALRKEYADVLVKKGSYDDIEKNILNDGVKLEDLEREVDILDQFPEEQKRNLVHFYKEFNRGDKKEEFKKLYAELVSDDQGTFRPDYVYIDDNETKKRGKDGRPVIKNEHRFSINHGEVCHSILNLNGTDLDVTWMGDSFGFARSYSSMTPEQIKALAEYCYAKGIDIQDFLNLKDLKVKDGEKEIGSVADELNKEIRSLKGIEEENPKEEGEKEFSADIQKSKDKYEEFSPDLGEVDLRNYSPCDYLKDPSLDVRKSVMVNAAEVRSGLLGNFDPALTKIKRGWNTTVISVYANENDKLVDGEYDKNGRRTRTKKFAVELTASYPPSARIYMGTDKEFTADHARLILDGFKKCGCKYFIVPPADQIGGKKAMGAWMKACVKAQMIPLCKTSEKSEGMVLGAADMHGLKEAFDDEVKSGGITGDGKIEFMLRIAEQVERQEQYLMKKNPKYQTPSSVAMKIEYFKHGAMFEKLQSSHLASIKKFIEDGVRKDGWDIADKAAAVKSLGHILKDMQEGKLNGKPLNPLAKDQWKDIRESMAYYMTREKPLIVENINKKIEMSEKDTQAKVDKAANEVYRSSEAYLNDVCADILENTGIEIKPSITKDINNYQQDTYKTEDERYQIKFPEPKRNEKTGKLEEGEVDYKAITQRAKTIDKQRRSGIKPRSGIREDDYLRGRR